MSRVSEQSRGLSPAQAALGVARAMKRALNGITGPLTAPRTRTVVVAERVVQSTQRRLVPGPDGGWVEEPYKYLDKTWERRPVDPASLAENQADYWDGVWRAAQLLRMHADQLSQHAATQARLIREQYPTHPSTTPEETPR